MPPGLSPALLALLDEHVDSFDKLELLMAVDRAPGRRTTVREMTNAIELDRDEIRRIANELAHSKLVVLSGTGELAIDGAHPVIDELIAAYTADRVTLVKAIADSSMNRLRNMAGRAFAEAFVIRKKPRGDND